MNQKVELTNFEDFLFPGFAKTKPEEKAENKNETKFADHLKIIRSLKFIYRSFH